MFGFGKGKFIKSVYEKINFFVDKAGVPNETDTLKQIKKEWTMNSAEEWNPKHTWQLLVSEQIHEVAYELRDDLYSRFKDEPNQAAIASISQLIVDLADAGKIPSLKNEQPDMYNSLSLLWDMCGHLATDPSHEQFYAHAVIVPRDGNPFTDE